MRGHTTSTKQPNKKQQQKHKQTRHNPKTARPVISWSVHSNLKRIRRDDNIVSPLGLVWQMKTRANQQQHENAIQQSVSQEATKAQCGNRGSPQPGASRSQCASRAGNILTDSGHYPKASNETAMWQKES